jgi:two-component system, OmpR family, KDP operon response regulator KdpE
VSRVLIVEDDMQLLRALAINLRARGYDVSTATDGHSALTAASRQPPDLVILDLGLPDMDGVDVVRGLRGWSTASVIVLSAREAQADKVTALDYGADDYVTKPFGMDELLARLRAAERRMIPTDAAPTVKTDAFTIDLAAKQASTLSGPVRLTPTEWHLLEVLLRSPGKLIGHKELLQKVWGPRYDTQTNYLRFYMAQLRRKLEADPAKPKHLLTEPGIGYRFQP